MNGFQTHLRGRRRTVSCSRRVMTVVCLVLLAVLAVAQVAHFHSDPISADHCPLCIVMHSAAPVGIAAAIIVLVQVSTPILQFEPAAVVRKRQTCFFIRPPPLAL